MKHPANPLRFIRIRLRSLIWGDWQGSDVCRGRVREHKLRHMKLPMLNHILPPKSKCTKNIVSQRLESRCNTGAQTGRTPDEFMSPMATCRSCEQPWIFSSGTCLAHTCGVNPSVETTSVLAYLPLVDANYHCGFSVSTNCWNVSRA